MESMYVYDLTTSYESSSEAIMACANRGIPAIVWGQDCEGHSHLTFMHDDPEMLDPILFSWYDEPNSRLIHCSRTEYEVMDS